MIRRSFIALCLLAFTSNLNAGMFPATRHKATLSQPEAPPAGPCTPGTTMVDVEFTAASSSILTNHTPATGGTWTGTDSANGELVIDLTNDWVESDSTSDGVHKHAWLSADMSSDVFTATATVNSTSGGTSTRNGIIFINPTGAGSLGWEGYRAHLGSGNFIFEKIANDGTSTTLVTSAQSNASGDRVLHVTRSVTGEWKVYALGTLRGTVTDTTYQVKRMGVYIRNVGAVKNILATCQ